MAMTMAEKAAHAFIEGEELVLEDFRERDADVVGFVREAEDAETAVHRCLTMGARVLKVAGATLDSELVEHRFEEMTKELDRKIVDFAERVDVSAESLLDEEEGKLALALHTWFEEVGSMLGETFDENSKTSAIAKLETVLEKAREEQVKAVRRLLDADNEESPLGRWRSEIVKSVKEQGSSIEQALDELREQLALQQGKDEVFQQTAVKGFTFEQVVLDLLGPIVTPHQDVPEHTGAVVGSEGTKVGDITVAINRSETPGRTIRYVIEAKDKPMSLKNALDEIESAMRNRDAQAGLMVFASQAECPVAEPFQWFEHKAVVVLDKEEQETSALRLACLWARWTACRDITEPCETIDAARVQSLLEAARRSLGAVTSIKGDHTKAKKSIDQASQHLDMLVAELKVTLDQLDAEVAAVALD